jgi:amino acid transporter
MIAAEKRRLRDVLLGPPRDPMSPETRKHIALAAFLAWIGIGADGLSSSAYGPAEAFIALGPHSQLALYLAIATAFTVFVISLAYNQVIELFPNGGGGYKVATKLVGAHAGLVAGAALVVDYVLTIAISVASGVDALFSLLPATQQLVKLEVEIGVIILLIYLNLRGMRESIRILAPIFIGFVITHFALIAYGIASRGAGLHLEIAGTIQETHDLASQAGGFFVLALFLKAYSLGGGTYTGIEAVSNNVNMLKEPRVRTGKWTMFLMALSLSITAGGIILLYLLWDVVPSHTGETLNAVVFGDIIDSLGFDGGTSHAILIVVLAFEGALLFVAANTGFLGGPAVLANMAVDRWVPNQFSALSSRLVTRNGVLLMGAAALGILIYTEGYVGLLVILYTVNVFITFTLSLLGLTIYWWKQRRDDQLARRRLLLSGFALLITAAILVVIVIERFLQGGIVTLFITSLVVATGLMIRRHYGRVRHLTRQFERDHRWQMREIASEPPVLQSRHWVAYRRARRGLVPGPLPKLHLRECRHRGQRVLWQRAVTAHAAIRDTRDTRRAGQFRARARQGGSLVRRLRQRPAGGTRETCPRGAAAVSEQRVLRQSARLREGPMVEPLAAQPDAAGHAAHPERARRRARDPPGHAA